MLEREELFTSWEGQEPVEPLDDPEGGHPGGQRVRLEVMAHYRASLEDNRLLAELLAL